MHLIEHFKRPLKAQESDLEDVLPVAESSVIKPPALSEKETLAYMSAYNSAEEALDAACDAREATEDVVNETRDACGELISENSDSAVAQVWSGYLQAIEGYDKAGQDFQQKWMASKTMYIPRRQYEAWKKAEGALDQARDTCNKLISENPDSTVAQAWNVHLQAINERNKASEVVRSVRIVCMSFGS